MNNNDHLEDFLNIIKEHHTHSVEKVNRSLYDDICKTAEIIERTESETEEIAIKESLRERFKNVDLNQVTDLFIYNQMFFTSNEDPLPTASILCINIGKLFTEQNLHYIVAKVYSRNEIEGGCALSFLGYLALQEHHRNYILNFIKENFEGFSKNKKTECVFQLKNYLSDDKIAQQIISDSGITEYLLTFSTEEDSSSRPITFNLENGKNTGTGESNEILHSSRKESTTENNILKKSGEKLNSDSPWWQFWKK
ncbi:hypothetical protein MKJ01_11670 [Chryseobacterium sp. SSA4.19]|uniref:hypothetical protein n=1 Tax=Chryseobacterium sp. SSA4.19 TaxID=2919915 RepID=UPI001F4D96BC|nr:hypothetical protein [Chryseobacterium sp. SSA4.19]MCJ8154420.1 hypothetical protein [Chryseobacterium sp. SSA4.19]